MTIQVARSTLMHCEAMPHGSWVIGPIGPIAPFTPPSARVQLRGSGPGRKTISYKSSCLPDVSSFPWMLRNLNSEVLGPGGVIVLWIVLSASALSGMRITVVNTKAGSTVHLKFVTTDANRHSGRSIDLFQLYVCSALSLYHAFPASSRLHLGLSLAQGKTAGGRASSSFTFTPVERDAPMQFPCLTMGDLRGCPSALQP